MANMTIAETREIDQLKERLVAKDKVIADLVEHLATISDFIPSYEYPYTVAYRKCGKCGHEELIKALPNGCFTSSIYFCTKCEAAWWDTRDRISQKITKPEFVIDIPKIKQGGRNV